MPRPVRYTFILVLVAIATGLAAAGGWRYARASAPVSGPVLIISVDTLRADHLPAYGYRKLKTPAFDALAADGVVFDRAYAHAPQTLPSHVSLLSGRLPFDTGVRDNVGFAVKPGERLLSQMLHDRGFSTGAVVSSYLLRKETGIGQGFDFFDGEMSPAPGDGTARSAPWENVQRDGALSEAIAEKWLNGIGTSRAFLFLHLDEPHAPYTPPERFASYGGYDGEIAYADEIVGHLVRYLKSHQLYDRSTVILLSDHGEGLGDHGEQEHGLFLYDEAIRVPLIVKQEGNADAGRRVKDVVQLVDLVPTILDFAKAPVPGNLHGRSLKPLLDGTGRLSAPAVYAEALYGRYHFGWSALTSITTDRYRFIKAPREELYDLQRDPREQQNLPAANAPERQSLRATLERLNDAAIPAPAEIDASARERLQSLGYVAGRPYVAADAAAGSDPLPDPKDKREVLERYRDAVGLAAERKWPRAIALLQQILRDDPNMGDVWTQLATMATRAERHDIALDAYKHLAELRPADPAARLGAAAALVRLKKPLDARQQAELALDIAEGDKRATTAAHEMLARIALTQHDADEARRQAQLAQETTPGSPLPAYVDGRLLYDQGKYEDALAPFEAALAGVKRPGAAPIAELHYFYADTLARLDRHAEAETEFLEELNVAPYSARARGGLAMVYQATGQPDEAERIVAEMVRITPTPDTYALAARLLTMFGNRAQAEALRAEAHRSFDSPRRDARH